jgi:hypothetical protein
MATKARTIAVRISRFMCADLPLFRSSETTNRLNTRRREEKRREEKMLEALSGFSTSCLLSGFIESLPCA